MLKMEYMESHWKMVSNTQTENYHVFYIIWKLCLYFFPWPNAAIAYLRELNNLWTCIMI